MKRLMTSYGDLDTTTLPQDECDDGEADVAAKSIRFRAYQCIASHPDTAVPPPHRILHIKSGYRPKLSLISSLPTFFLLHNQTVNVWTHFLGLIWFLWITPSTLKDAYTRGTTVDVVMFSIFLGSAEMCLFFSTLFHLFGSVSDVWMARFLALDLLGICSLILGSFALGVYQGFYCHPPLVALYVSVVLFGVLISGVLATAARFRESRYDTLRNTVFVCTVAFAVVPLGHWLTMCWETDAGTCQLSFISYCLAMLASYGVGFLVYALKVPERLAPGYFDLFFHSHQWWHVFVFGGAAIWYFANLRFFDHRVGVPYDLCHNI